MKLDKYEEEVLAAFEAGALLPIATKEDLEQIRESARATATNSLLKYRPAIRPVPPAGCDYL
jgi:hypothetical protein